MEPQPIEEEVNKTRQKVHLKKILDPLITLIRENNIIFLCNNTITDEKQILDENDKTQKVKQCNKYLFSSHDIDSLYSLEKNRLCFVMDSSNIINFNQNFKKDEKIQFVDEELNQSDCIFQKIKCINCQTVIGRIFHSVSFEKDQLLLKIIILTDKIKSVNISGHQASLIKIESYIQIKTEQAEEIKEFCEVNNQIKECIDSLLVLFKKTKDYLSIKDSMKNTDEYSDSLARLTKYIDYTLEKEN